jgi:hypothetical protein
VLEVAVLAAVAEVGGLPGARRRRTTRVLERLEREDGLGARYVYPLLQDLGAPWRLHLPLLDPYGNWGSQQGDPAADAQYTELRLSPVGALALAAERGQVAPVPLGLVEGSLYRDGPVPPFDPRRVVAALRTGSGDAGLPTLPTGGTVDGDLPALLRGRRARLQLGCGIVHEESALVLEAVPLGVPIDLVEQCLATRSLSFQRSGAHPFAGGSGAPEPDDAPLPFRIVDVRDESSMHVGVRVVVQLAPGSDLAAAERWVRSVWPVTVEVDCRLPASMAERLRTWDAGDGSGLQALELLLDRAGP